MTEPNEEELPDTSTGEDAQQPDSSKGADAGDTESSSPESSQPKPKSKAESREDLIKSLTQPQKVEEDDAEEEDPADSEKDESQKEPESKEVAEGEKEPEGSKHDTSDKRSKAKERFEVLTNHNKELKAENEKNKPFVDYATKVLDFCKAAGISTAEVGAALSLVATAKKDPAAAEQFLPQLGIKAKEVVQKVVEVPAELEDQILELVSNGNLTPDGMKTLLGITRKARAAAPAPKEPETQVKQTQSVVTPLANQPSAEQLQFNSALAKAKVDLDLKDDEYAAKYPADWPKLRPKLLEAMKLYNGTHPSTWVTLFEKEVAAAVASVKKTSTPSNPPLRPSSTKSTAKAPPPNSRAALIAELTGKAGKKA